MADSNFLEDAEIEVDDDSEDYEEIDDLDESRKTLSTIPERKIRVQEINIMIKKLLEERDELERAIEFSDDDLPSED